MMRHSDKASVADLLHSLHSRYLTTRREALQALLRREPLTPFAIADLTEVLHDADLRIGAGAATLLGRIGAEATPALITALGNPNKYVRREAARALGKLGSEAGDAVLPLANLLCDPDLKTRTAVALALGLIGPAAQEAAPALIAALADRHRFFHRLVSWVLTRLGETVVPVLHSARESPDANVRREAAHVLDQMERHARAHESTRSVPMLKQEPCDSPELTPLVPCG